MKKAEYLQATEQGTATYGATMFADLSSNTPEHLLNFLQSPVVLRAPHTVLEFELALVCTES